MPELLNTTLLPFHFRAIPRSPNSFSDEALAQKVSSPDSLKEREEIVRDIKKEAGGLFAGEKAYLRMYKKMAYRFFIDKMEELGDGSVPFKTFPEVIFGRNRVRDLPDGVYMPELHLIYVRCEFQPLGVMKASGALGHELSHGISAHLFPNNGDEFLHLAGIPTYEFPEQGGAIDNALAIEDSLDFMRKYVLADETKYVRNWLDYVRPSVEKTTITQDFQNSPFHDPNTDDLTPILLQSNMAWPALNGKLELPISALSYNMLNYFYDYLKLSRGLSAAAAFTQLDQSTVENLPNSELVEYGRSVLDVCKLFGQPYYMNALTKFFSKEEQIIILNARDDMVGLSDANKLIEDRIVPLLKK